MGESKMVIRVRDAIAEGFTMPRSEAADPFLWLAKCAIRAMREPTEQMLAILDDNKERGKYRWQAAIDVALVQPPVDSN